MQKFVIASANSHKIDEFRNILKPFGIKLVPYKEILGSDFEIEETGATFEENAKIKAELVAKKTKLPVISDDSGFSINILDGFPGLYSARFAEEMGGYENAMSELYSRMKDREDKKNKDISASFTTVIAFVSKDGDINTFTGICNGYVSPSPRGVEGFGYDPMFIPNGYGATFAEMGSEEKNLISHRSVAISKFVEYLEKLKEQELNTPKTVKATSKPKIEEVEVKIKEEVEILEVVDNVVDENVFNIEVDRKF